MDETYSAYHRVLSIVGISIFAKKNWQSKRWLFLQIFNFIIGILCFIFTTGFVTTNSSDLLLFIQGACIWTTGAIMTISLGICLFFRSDFREFLQEMAFKDNMLEMPLIKYVLQEHRGEKLLELKRMVEGTQGKLLKYTRVLLKTYVASVFVCATLYLCTPIYEMIQKQDDSLRLLAFDMWFPWSMENFGVYIASFILHAYCGYLCCIAYPGLQSIIILLVGQIIRQLRILTFILLHLNELVMEINANQHTTWQPCCTAVLTQCVDHYSKIKRFSNKLNTICRPFYLTLILVAIMLVCMCSVKIAISKICFLIELCAYYLYGFIYHQIRHHTKKPYSAKQLNSLNKLSPDTMKYYVHELCFILVVLMFCLLGQQVDNECAQLQYAVTEKWYIFDRKHKKNILIFSMALSQRMPIYIFGTISLSLPTFTWFIRTGMSFFTLVMSVLEEIQ